MQRRSFVKGGILSSAGMMLGPLPGSATPAAAATLDQLEAGFASPPAWARPWVFWQWMNGHITRDGISLDLAALKRMGIGGAICFNNATGIPRGPVDYASDAWMDLTVHAFSEAARLGLEMAVHNAPGYSGCGGPWVTPEMSMQQLVWTDTLAAGDGVVRARLPQPYAKHGYYRDAMVVAYPSLAVERHLMRDQLRRILVDGREIDQRLLTDGSPETRLRLDAQDPAIGNVQPSIVFEFVQPFEARAITVLRKAELPQDLYDGPRDHPPMLRLESSSDGVEYTLVGTVVCTELREMDTPATLSFDARRASHYRLSADRPTWISSVELHNGPRLAGWEGKTSHTKAGSNGVTPPLDAAMLIDPAQVRDISRYMDGEGKLHWPAPPGRWTILRIGHTSTGEEPAAHPDSAKGLEIDKFRKDALDLHMSAFLGRLIERARPYIGRSFKGVTVDSWEAGKQNWTADFPQAFRASAGYEIAAWMPALTGRIVGSVSATEGFLWDTRRVQADLLAANFYGHLAATLHKEGLELHGEPYGDGNLDSLKIGTHLDVPMSEFWTRYIYGSDVYSRQAASIGRANGRRVVAAEAYTTMPDNAKWTDYPYSLKAEGDYFFTLGVNRLTFHTFVHQPYRTGFPGMTMGPFGAHFDRNNTWTGQAHAWTAYLQRSQYLLQHGLAVADVCYFQGDDPVARIPDLSEFLPYGYAGDVIGPDVLHQRARVEHGRIVLPDGMSYSVCMLAPVTAIAPATLARLGELVAAGMTLLVSGRPQRAVGRGHHDTSVRALADALYGDLDGVNRTERAHGRGRVIWEATPACALRTAALAPDFAFSACPQDAAIHYLHKVIDGSDVYLIANQRRRREQLVVSLRSGDRQPEIWNAEDGSRREAPLYGAAAGRLTVALDLEPAQAVFVVLRRAPLLPAVRAIERDGRSIASLEMTRPAGPEQYSSVQNNFTITAWIKPDNVARPGRSMLFHPGAGEALFGKGHVAAALSAGTDAVRVYERGAGGARVVLTSRAPVQGWTHVALVYLDGAPALYLNGTLAGSAAASGALVHPGLATPSARDQYSTYFEGNYTAPELAQRALPEREIRALFNAGLPAPAAPAPVTLWAQDGGLRARIWQNGRYRVAAGQGTHDLGHIDGCGAHALARGWSVDFPPGSGAPATIALDRLVSLKHHRHFDVRHFAGTARYRNRLTITAQDLQQSRRLFLDLGRVEVVAALKVNGRPVAVLWKEPFMADITDALKIGSNRVEIEVTTLWYNRLVGDEHLPPEHAYTADRLLKQLPDWYVNNRAKPGKRLAFAVWKHFTAADPLLESGLLGPVRLLSAVERVLPAMPKAV